MNHNAGRLFWFVMVLMLSGFSMNRVFEHVSASVRFLWMMVTAVMLLSVGSPVFGFMM